MVSLRYQDKGSVIHGLNPFCKLLWIINVLVFALIFNNPIYILLLFLSTLPLIIIARVTKEWASVMKFTFFLCLAIIIINALVSQHGTHLLFEAPFHLPVIGTPVITIEAIFFGIAMSLRILTIISAFTLITFTIHPDDLMVSMIKLKVPYKSVLVTSLSTRFIPTLIDDMECISAVHRSRGVELDKGHLQQRIKNRALIIIPLLSNSLDRAVQVSEAMESRAFGSGEKRTFYKETKISQIDAITLLFGVLTLVFGIFLNLSGYGNYQYYPTLTPINMDAMGWSMLVILILLLLSIMSFALVKRRFDLD